MPLAKILKKDEEFIIQSRNRFPAKEIGRRLGLSKTVILRFLKKRGLSVSPEQTLIFRRQGMTGKTTSTPEMDKVIRKYYLELPRKAIARQLCKSETFVKKRIEQLGLIIPASLIEKRKADSRFKPRHTPVNKGKRQTEYMSPEAIARSAKTRFKKGQLPYNTKCDNYVSARYHRREKKYYLYIRLALRRWQLYDRYVWEQANGKIPCGHVILHKDGDYCNNELSNLECISMKENMRRNSIQRYPEELKRTIKLISKLNKKINNATKRNERPEQPSL